MVETFVVAGFFEAFPHGEDGHVRHLIAAGASAVPAKGIGGICRKEVPCNPRAVLPADRDDGRPVRYPGIGVVDDDGTPGAERSVDQLLLSSLGMPIVAHQVLAHQLVGRRKALPVERGFARGGQSDQDDALHVCIAAG